MSSQTDLIDYILELINSDTAIIDHAYDILRVHPSAEEEVIESAYRRLLRLYHPDVNKHYMADATTKIIISCYEMLREPTQRAAYDAYLASKSEDNRSVHEIDRDGQIAFLLERGESFADEEETLLAIQDFTSVIELDPHNAAAYQWRGCLYGQNNCDLAIGDFTKAIELNPINWVAYRSRSSAYFYNGDSNRAERDYAKAEELYTTHPSSLELKLDSLRSLLRLFTFGILIGDTCKIRSNIKKADLSQAIDFYAQLQERTRPQHAFIYSQLGQQYSDQGDFGLAIRNYEKAIELNPESVFAHLGYSYACTQILEYDLAIRALTRVIEMNPNDTFAYQARGDAYLEKGEDELAAKDFERARLF